MSCRLLVAMLPLSFLSYLQITLSECDERVLTVVGLGGVHRGVVVL